MQDPRADLKQWLSHLSIDLGETGFEKAFTRMTETADRSGGAISDEQLRSIVDEVVSGMEVLDEVAASYQ